MAAEGYHEKLSPWWRRAVIITLIAGFAVLLGMSGASYKAGPPIPRHFLDPSGDILFTGDDVRAGQQVFLKYGLMENGTIWGHGAYLGPDFSAAYLHKLATDTQNRYAQDYYKKSYANLATSDRNAVDAYVQTLLKQNRYDSQAEILQLTPFEAASYEQQIKEWRGLA